MNGMSTESKGMVQITIQSTRDGFRKELTCLAIPAISDLIPNEVFPRHLITIPPNVKLADPEFQIPRAIDLLIGSGATLSMFCIGQIDLSTGNRDLFLQKTRLGWVVAGYAPTQTPPITNTCLLTNLEKQIAKFWAIEELDNTRPKTDEETEIQRQFETTTSRENDGRYTVRLPFRATDKRLGGSRAGALKRLTALERKLDANADLKAEYTRVIEEYLDLQHLEPVPDFTETGYYMPHHAVIKEASSTTKVRVVFDASAKTDNGVSLNELLMVGPTIQDTLFAHLIRFRTYKYAITADIEKMYRQVWVHRDDRPYQRILWRRHGQIETYQLKTLTFGVSASPFLAIRVIQQLAEDERHIYPRAATTLSNHLYVDDLLTGANTIAEARALRNETITLLARGGFKIRQWASNDTRVVSDLEPDAIHAKINLQTDEHLKTLGIAWSITDDTVRYSVNPVRFAERLTKRNILSEIAKIFDPMGLLGPVILYAKKIMQDVWRCGVHWDESVPQSIHSTWSELVRQLEILSNVSFDRKLLIDNHRDSQIHGFCDASNVGYGACLYLRSRDEKGKTKIALICAKSRVAPLKTITIPRLELCGALLLAQLYREVSTALPVTPTRTVFWCDSTIVLHWLRTAPARLQTFAANRVATIQDHTTSGTWRHVRSGENPADALSRGQLPCDFLHNALWRSGPAWLKGDKGDWPNEDLVPIEVPELKRNACLLTTINHLAQFEKYSSYSKLLRITTYCLRFRTHKERSGALSAEELNEAERRVLRALQAATLSTEIKRLKAKGLEANNKLANLSPFIDSNGLVRVGGRLQESRLEFARKHPILLPSRQRLTDTIIRETHEKHHHPGIQTTLCILRQKFWLLDGRNQVRKIVRSCTRCFRFTANPVAYKMGNLPPARIREATPFTNTGIDYCGPFFIKERKHRNRNRIKVYVCVFVCLSVKAIHLELVTDLTTEGFLAALRRFTARRGVPEHIYSDNGTNFVGANNQLKELYAMFNSTEHANRIHAFASNKRIQWHFIPPAAPHFGGLWEASVKLFKHHFKRVVGESLFTFEELNTFTIEIEGILNSRPLISLSSDPNDLLVLTPAHYLIGKPITTLPEGDLSSVPANRLSTWRHISKVRQDFWARWNLEYLNELQTRHKWVKDGPNLLPGTVVLVKDKGLPCMQWVLGRITKVHPGNDGVTRAATVQTAAGELKRAVNRLCPLPVDQPT